MSLVTNLYFKEKKLSYVFNEKNMIDMIETENSVIIFALNDYKNFKGSEIGYDIRENTITFFNKGNNPEKLTPETDIFVLASDEEFKTENFVIAYPLESLEIKLKEIINKNKKLYLKLISINKDEFISDFKNKLHYFVEGENCLTEFKNKNPHFFINEKMQDSTKEIVYDVLNDNNEINHLMFLEVNESNPLLEVKGLKSKNYRLV